MDSSEFDKYIKKFTKGELEVPEQLDWDMMNIPLPGEEEEKKKKKFLWIWLFSGVVLLGVVIGSFLLKPADTAVGLMEQSTPEPTKNTEISEKTKPKKQVESISNINTQNLDQDNGKDIIETKSSQAFQEGVSQNANAINPTSSINTSSIINSKSQIRSESFANSEKSNKQEFLTKNPRKLGSSIKQDLNNKLISIKTLNSLSNSLTWEKRDLIQIDAFNPYFPINKTTESNRKVFAAFINFGTTYSRTNFSNSTNADALNDAEEAAIGLSIQSGLRAYSTNNFFLESGLSYKKLHSTFTYSQEIDTEIDLLLRQRSTFIENVFHNNYTDLLELNSALGKELTFMQNWGLRIKATFNAGYLLQFNGKTLNEESSVIELKNYKSGNRLMLSAGANSELFYAFKNYHISIGVDFRRNFSNLKIFENSDLRFEPRIMTFNLGLARKF